MYRWGTTNLSLFHRQLSTLFFCKYRLSDSPKFRNLLTADMNVNIKTNEGL
uniref:Uncharacterized protein n=1 Tax=Sphingobacterium sp. (strain 21) TaxID=743722 RepID=F4C4H4_SPHS2